MKGAAIEIKELYSDEKVHKNYLWMDSAIQIIANDKTVRNDTIQDLNDFNSQSLTTQAKRGEQLVSMMPPIRKTFDLMGDDMVELSRENDPLKKNRKLWWKMVEKIWSKIIKTVRRRKTSKFNHVQDEKTDGNTLKKKWTTFTPIQILMKVYLFISLCKWYFG